MTSEAKAVHSPQLDTVLMVESFIREHSGEYKKKAVWENLPKKMMYQTFTTVIIYLQDSGKIATDSDKKYAGSIIRNLYPDTLVTII